MLSYSETNWRKQNGLQIDTYQVIFNEVKSKSTVEEQKERAERLSLVKIFNEWEINHFFEISTRFHKNDEHFYFHRDKKFHTTLLGFPVIESAYYEAIREKINQYFEQLRPKKMSTKFDVIRLGTKYENNNTLKPDYGVSNGTIIAFGDNLHNTNFINLGNKLARFLIEDRKLNSVLGSKFRRKFPTVWCTMGHYITDFKITDELEKVFNEYKELDSNHFRLPCFEFQLGRSHYKDLRDWKVIQTFSIMHETS